MGRCATSKYLTPAILRAGGLGVDVSTFSDIDLAALLDDAEGLIDAYMGFDEDASLGFATGAHTERQPWHEGTRRVYPRCAPVPVQSVTSFAIQFSQQQGTGAPQVATVDPTLIVINNDLGYLEGVSLAVLVYGIMPALNEIAMLRPFALYTYTAGYQIAKVNWRLYANTTADPQTYHSLIPTWDTTVQTPSVSINGTVQATNTYTLDPADGVVVFGTPPASGSAVTASFTHQIPDVVTRATKLCLLERLGDFLANQEGLAGYDVVQEGKVTRRRRGTSAGAGGLRWQDLLDDLVPVHIAAT